MNKERIEVIVEEYGQSWGHTREEMLNLEEVMIETLTEQRTEIVNIVRGEILTGDIPKYATEQYRIGRMESLHKLATKINAIREDDGR